MLTTSDQLRDEVRRIMSDRAVAGDMAGEGDIDAVCERRRRGQKQGWQAQHARSSRTSVPSSTTQSMASVIGVIVKAVETLETKLLQKVRGVSFVQDADISCITDAKFIADARQRRLYI